MKRGVDTVIHGESGDCFGCTANSKGPIVRGIDTVRTYDEGEYQLDEHERWLNDRGYVGRPYRGSLLLTEAGPLSAQCSRDVLLSMAAGYIYLRLCDRSSELLKCHIPYRYRRGRFHERREGKYRRWDMRLEANGREALVEEIQRRIWAYEEERLECLLTQWDVGSRSCVYFVEEAGSPRATTHIVFSNKSALERVRFSSLLPDCRAIQQHDRALTEAIEVERSLLARFIAVQCTEAVRSCDPRIVRLPRGYRVLMAMP